MGYKVVVNDKAIEESMGELSAAFARNAGAVADLLNRWREPTVARAVLDSILARDGRRYHELLGLDPAPEPGPDPLEPPPQIPDLPNFCTVIFRIAESLVPSKQAWVCRLRTDLSTAERFQYVAIARRCGLILDANSQSGFSEVGGRGPIVPDGPCRQALIDAGLVNCDWEPIDNGIAIQFGPPTQVCARP